MKFSYSIFKKLVPAIPNKSDLIEKLNLYLFEAEDINDDSVEIKILPNRYGDAACYWGLARELSAIYRQRQSRGLKIFPRRTFSKRTADVPKLKISIKTKNCRRLTAQYVTGLKIGPSPPWLAAALAASGLRPINNLVDITNYATLETGQPLHAFDWDKLHGSVVVRQAINEEPIELLSGEKFHLTRAMAVIADQMSALDIAGIKGGKKAEITGDTRRILLTAANFEPANIYETSGRLRLVTDASVRFSHGLSPELTPIGLGRAAALIEELCGGRARAVTDVYPQKQPKKLIKFNIEKFERLTGLHIKTGKVLAFFKKLGFTARGLLIEIPPIRLDILRFEDLAEEAVRLYGWNKLPGAPPRIHLQSAQEEEMVVFQDKVRRILTGFGLTEVRNYSFGGEELTGVKQLELANPISADKKYLRFNLTAGLEKNLQDNLRFFDRAAIFEIGKVFQPEEKWALGLALGEKKKDTILELKGMADGLLEKLGVVDYHFVPTEKGLVIKIGSEIVGYLQNQTTELGLRALLRFIGGEKEFRPFSQYPAVERDISLFIPEGAPAGKILETMKSSGVRYLEDVYLIDSYKPKEGGKSLTFRIVFQTSDKTLTDEEADAGLKKIIVVLVDKFNVDVR